MYVISHSCKILEKSLEQLLRKSITDGWTDKLTWAITKALSGKPGVQNVRIDIYRFSCELKFDFLEIAVSF